MSFIIQQYTLKYNIKASTNLAISRDDLLDSIQYDDHIKEGYQPLCFTKILTGHKDVLPRAFSASALSKEWKQGGTVLTLKNTSKLDLTKLNLTIEIVWTNEKIGTFAEL